MFEIFVDEVWIGGERILLDGMQLAAREREIREVRGILSGLSGMGEPCAALDTVCDRVRRYSSQLEAMRGGLVTITRNFEETESLLKNAIFQIG